MIKRLVTYAAMALIGLVLTACVSIDTPRCDPSADSVHGGKQQCGLSYYFSADSAPLGHFGRLVAQMFAKGETSGEFYLTEQRAIPEAGEYAGFWTCTGKSALPLNAPKQSLVRESNTPCSKTANGASACIILDKNIIEVRRGISPLVKSGYIRHEELERDGCHHKGSHGEETSNLHVIIDLRGATIADLERGQLVTR